MVAYTEKGKRAYTNPIWLEVDNSISLFDFTNAGEVVASFKSNGDLDLKGKCFYSANCVEDENSMIFQNSNKETTAYIDSEGNLCLETNSCEEIKKEVCNPSVDSFLVQENPGVNLSYIDFNGKMCLTGKLNEEQ